MHIRGGGVSCAVHAGDDERLHASDEGLHAVYIRGFRDAQPMQVNK